MKPKIATSLRLRWIALVLVLMMLTGCIPTRSTAAETTTPPSPESTEATEVPQTTESAEASPNPQEPVVPMTVDNDGGNFSQEDLIYFIVTDRFKQAGNQPLLGDVNKNDPKAFHGGNLKGVTASLDYIKSLGSTTIWLTPIQTNGPKGYHGYWIYDFWSVDPHLGTIEDMKQLVKEAHKRDMKVIMDYVVNHTGYDSPWLNDPQKSKWFNPKRSITNWNDEKQLEKGWLFGLPDLDLDNKEVEQFFVDNALWWIGETGIDGMRLDTVKHVPRSFWINWNKAIKDQYPDFYLLGEVWTEHVSILERYRETGIDAMTNYPLYEGLTSALSKNGRVSDLANSVLKDQKFSGSEISGIFVDNHDNERLISKDPKNGLNYLRLGLVWAYSYPAIPILYYGTEVGLEGGKDPDNRRDMPWDNTPQPELLSLTKALAKWRLQSNSDYQWLYHNEQIAVYYRSGHLVVLNFSEKDAAFEAVIPASHYSFGPSKKISAYTLPGVQAPDVAWNTELRTLTGSFKPFQYGIYPVGE